MGPLLLIGVSAAWPCGGITHSEGALAEADAAEVLFEPGPDAVAVSYAVRYTGDAPDLGWVIPVPAAPTAVEDGDLDRFDALRQVSQPMVTVIEGSDSDGGVGCGCGGAAKSGDGGSFGERGNDVDVVAEGFTGTYEYVAIQAADVADLEAWFDDNGWTGLATEALDHYVAAGSTFVALRVVPDTAKTPVEGRTLPPVRITYPGDAMVWPAVMLRYGTALTQRTTVFVAGDSRATVEGWTVEDGGTVSGGLDDDPVALWDERLSAAGDGGGWVRTFAGDVAGAFVTRFDTIAPREAHDADAVFVLEDETYGLYSEIVLSEGGGTAALLLLPLAGVGAWRRRRAG